MSTTLSVNSIPRKSCGANCKHLRCQLSVCERAQLWSGHSSVIKRAKDEIESLLYQNRYQEALNVLQELLDTNMINLSRFELFRLKNFSSPLPKFCMGV